MLLRKLLEVGKCCPREMLYLETGSRPIRFIIMSRRLKFLHYILNEDNKSLINQVLQEQMKSPVKNDWILTVWEDLKELEIGLEIKDIEELSKEGFKRFIDKKIDARVLEYLNDIKSKHKKVCHIKHENLKIQKYLTATDINNTNIAKFIFHARCRMLDVKEDFKNRYEGAGTTCALGCDESDNQEHLISCNKIETDYLVLENDQPNYQNLFSDEIEKQSKIAIILQERYKKRTYPENGPR